MSRIPQVGDLQIHQNLEHSKREAKVERVAWAFFLLILAAAVAGILGPGPLSHAVAGTRDSALWIEYNRFEHSRRPGELVVHIGPSAGGKVGLSLSRDYFERVQIANIEPAPERTVLTPEAYIYEFARGDPARPAAVILHFEARRAGFTRVRMRLDSGAQVGFTQFFFP
ncbi:MAG: hypothetical protein HYZ57_17050 [Acidobacteria bacterium]|nr:hypothetical protein [Acidobacteriota bacterium]MBI3281538.1 hypothetical protein [Acidobacteriota bacterium]